MNIEKEILLATLRNLSPDERAEIYYNKRTQKITITVYDFEEGAEKEGLFFGIGAEPSNGESVCSCHHCKKIYRDPHHQINTIQIDPQFLKNIEPVRQNSNNNPECPTCNTGDFLSKNIIL